MSTLAQNCGFSSLEGDTINRFKLNLVHKHSVFFSNLVCVCVFMYFFYCVFGVFGVCLMCNLVSAAL